MNQLSLFVILFSLSSCLSEAVESEVRVDICETVDPDVIIWLPAGDDCTKYIECYNGHGTEVYCPDGLWYNPKIGNCDLPGDYCFWWSTTPPPHTLDPRCQDGNTIFWPHPTLCNRYIECYLGDSYEVSCPSGLYFSYVQQKCVSASQSECCISSTQC